MSTEWTPHSCDRCINLDPIKNYDKFELIGTGGFAKVYRGIRLCDGFDIAIKIMDKQQLKLKNAQSRVNEEVQIHYRLRHSAIVQLLEVFEDDTNIYLILELCATDMQKYLNIRQQFTEDETRHYIRQIVTGIEYLHSHQILHRDLKLHNLLLTKENNVKIADFGLAKQLITHEQSNFTMVGTPNFLAPEIATRKTHSFEADIWSLGALIYQCLVGKPPFDDQDVLSTLKRVANVRYVLPDGLSHETKDLINRILQKDTKKRLTLVQIRNHPFLSKRDRMNSSRNSCTSLRSDSGYFDTSISSRQQTNESTVSRGPTILNSLPPLMMNKNQKINASSTSVLSCNNLSHTKFIRERLTPLNTERLDRRHVITKSDIMDVLDDGEVVIQHLVEVKNGSKRIVDVFRVSSDGQKIIYYRPDRRQYNSYIESEGPLPLPANYEQYTFDTLPEQFYNKYRRAWKFVNIIRSLRCKIIMYTNDGKCRLMETSIEFDFTHINGTKISIYRKNLEDANSQLEIKLVDPSGRMTSIFNYNDSIEQLNVPLDTKQMLQKTIKFRECCLRKNQILEEHHAQFPEGKTFPAIFGEKSRSLK
jgi:polo-like kinase 4